MTPATLAPPRLHDLTDAGAALTVQNIEAAAVAVIASTDAGYAADQAGRAELVRKLIAQSAAAGEVRTSLVRYELICLRHAAILDPEAGNLLPRAQHERRQLLNYLGGLTDIEFAARLEEATAWLTPVGLWRRWKLEYERLDLAVAADGWKDDPDALDLAPVIDFNCLDSEIASVLGAASAAGVLDIPAAAANLANRMFAEENRYGGRVADLIADAIRHAIRQGEQVAPDGFPEWVTVRTEDRWLRIPFESATVGQLRWMLQYRRQQLDNLASSVDLLAASVDRLADDPDARRLYVAVSSLPT